MAETSEASGRRSEGTGRGGRRAGDRLDARALALGVLASVAVHAALFLWAGGFTVRVPEGRSGGTALETWGDALEVREVAERRAAPLRIPTPPPPRMPKAEEPRVELRTASARPTSLRFASTAVEPASAGGGGVAGSPAGRGAGEAGSGRGSEAARDPVPRSLVPQWDPPSEIRGTRVTIRVHVDPEGRPTGEVELRPPTADEGFNRELIETVRRMEYLPARRGGQPVAGWAEITFVF